MFEGQLKTRLQDGELYYELFVLAHQSYYEDDIPTGADLSFFDVRGEELMEMHVPLSSTGERGRVYSSSKVQCPGEKEVKIACDSVSYIRATQWSMRPTGNRPDPAIR